MQPSPEYDNETRLEGEPPARPWRGEPPPPDLAPADTVLRRQLTPAGALLADLDAQVRALVPAAANDDALPSTLPAEELPPCA